MSKPYKLVSQDPFENGLPFEYFGTIKQCLRMARIATYYQYTNWSIVRSLDGVILIQNANEPKKLGTA